MLSAFVAVLAKVMFGLVAAIFLVEILEQVAARVRRPRSPADDRRPQLPGSFQLRPTVSKLARRYQVDRLARWT